MCVTTKRVWIKLLSVRTHFFFFWVPINLQGSWGWVQSAVNVWAPIEASHSPQFSLIQRPEISSLRLRSVIYSRLQMLWWCRNWVAVILDASWWYHWRRWRWGDESARNIEKFKSATNIHIWSSTTHLFPNSGDVDASSSLRRNINGLWLPLVFLGGGSGLACREFCDALSVASGFGGVWANGFVVAGGMGETLARDLSFSLFSFALCCCSRSNLDRM